MRSKILTALALVSLLPAGVLGGDVGALQSQVDRTAPAVLSTSFDRQPLSFTQNLGQWPDEVLFRADAAGAILWFTRVGVTYQFTRTVQQNEGGLEAATFAADAFPETSSQRASLTGGDEPGTLRSKTEQLCVKAAFVGAERSARAVGQDELDYKCNYFVGDDPTRWRTDVPNFRSVLIREVYPGIDVNFTGGADRQLQCEFVVAPGADASQITIAYEGADGTSLDADGRLLVETKWGRLTGVIDASDYVSNTASPTLQTRSGDAFGVEVAGEAPNSSQALTVGLSFSTYLGGTGLDEGWAIVHDDSGSAYVAGTTFSTAFPTQDPYQTNQPAGDVVVTRLTEAGNALVYSTYIGGNDDDYPRGIALDESGNVYVTGVSYSTNFPTLNPYQTDQGGLDAFVVKLSPSGNSLEFATYLGGSGEDWAYGIALDSGGSAYVAGYTLSVDFPTQSSYQTDQGGIDVFVTRLTSSGSGLVYSTYLGGTGDDYGRGIALDESGHAYVTATSFSANFPTQGPYQAAQGAGDVVVTKLAPSGDSLVYSTYLGGGADEYPRGIALDDSGCAYVTGVTMSSGFPTQNPYQPNQGGNDAFVTKLSSTGDSLVYSTYLGGGGTDIGWHLAVDDGGNAYITGSTQSSDFPTENEYQTYQAGDDAFVTKLSSAGDSAVYSTILGGSGTDLGYDISVDARGRAYVTGTAGADFPTLDPFQATQTAGDVFVTRLTPFPDTDDDGIDDQFDNCSLVSNPGQEDADGDAFGDACDVCAGGDDALDADGDAVPDFCDVCPGFDDALDLDSDDVPDGCDTCPSDPLNDTDSDGVCGSVDNCPAVANSDQLNTDGDAEGDACDPDDDNDGTPDATDNCPLVANGSQTDTDGDAEGDACDPDDDNDGISDATDNCPLAANASQSDNDGDSEGDACDPDDDNDGVPDATDNCPLLANAGQANADGDAEGDDCDADDDNDGIPDATDNCPLAANGSQTDTDGDTEGDACDPDDDNDGIPDVTDNCPLLVTGSQEDTDDDGVGNSCDNCPTLPNPGQEDSDHNGIGDECTCPILVTGDVNLSGNLTSADIISTVNYVFKSGMAPLPCEGSADVNCTGGVTSADIISMVNHVFKGGTPPCDACTLFPDTWRCD